MKNNSINNAKLFTNPNIVTATPAINIDRSMLNLRPKVSDIGGKIIAPNNCPCL
mgnify:FL=1